MENVEEQEIDTPPELMRFETGDDIPEEYADHMKSVELDGVTWICPSEPEYLPTVDHIYKVSNMKVLLDRNPQAIDDSPLELPIDFPSEQDVYATLLNAVRECVSSNMLRPMSKILYPALNDKATVFNDSIAFKEIGMSGSLDLFSGRLPIQQFLGKVLYDDEVILAFLKYPVNSVINANSMRNTRVLCDRPSEDRVISITHKMPLSSVAIRYLSNTQARIRDDGDFMYISLDIEYDPDNMDGLMSAARLLEPSLHIYSKLLTRFPSCQSCQISLPDFRTS